MTKLATCKAVLIATVASLISVHGSALAFDLSSSLLEQPKPLWREFMKSLYGSYDHQRKCWIAKQVDQRYCMRPHRLDLTTSEGHRYAFFVIGGSRIDKNGELEQSHADTGVLGLVIMKEQGDHLETVAKNNLFEDFGSFGSLPNEDQFEVHQIGPHGAFGWTAIGGWSGQGINVNATTIFAPIGDKITSIGSLPHHFDDQGDCTVRTDSNTPCSDYTFDFMFDSQDQSQRFYPIVLKLSGSRAGVQFDQSFLLHFDPEKFRYEDIKNLPAGMEDDG